jgi:hypothetical protein
MYGGAGIWESNLAISFIFYFFIHSHLHKLFGLAVSFKSRNLT